MALKFQSRFSVLTIEDDDMDSDEDNIVTAAQRRNAKKVVAPPAPALNKTKKKKKASNANETSELQNLVIATGKQKMGKSNNSNNSSRPPVKVKDKQWEEWKQTDDKFVHESYHQDLEQALLLSKLDFEERKPVHNTRQKEVDQDKQNGGDLSKKKKKLAAKKDKPATLSLEQFQNLLPSQIEAGVTNETIQQEIIAQTTEVENRKISVSENDFFDKIGEDADKIVQAEQRKDSYKKNEPLMADQVRSLELREILKQKVKLVDELQTENEELKSNLKAAKQRNRKLCNILAQGEIRDKAEILVQVENLIQIREELTNEVSELSQALEQERSKVHSLQTELKKQGTKKEAKESKSAS